MKILFVLALAALASARPEDGDYYDSKYDNFDIDNVISNIRILKAYVQCFLESGSCSPDATYFKGRLTEAIKTECAKCSEKQKIHVAKAMKAVQEKLSDDSEKVFQAYSGEDKERDKQRMQSFIAKYA